MNINDGSTHSNMSSSSMNYMSSGSMGSSQLSKTQPTYELTISKIYLDYVKSFKKENYKKEFSVLNKRIKKINKELSKISVIKPDVYRTHIANKNDLVKQLSISKTKLDKVDEQYKKLSNWTKVPHTETSLEDQVQLIKNLKKLPKCESYLQELSKDLHTIFEGAQSGMMAIKERLQQMHASHLLENQQFDSEEYDDDEKKSVALT